MKKESCKIKNYLKSLNPKKEDRFILVYGSSYDVWRDSKYLGVATWTKDENVGDSFQRDVIDERGRVVSEVFIADAWALRPNGLNNDEKEGNK